MRYASIRSLDVSNGENIGVSLFTQGCDRKPHCKNCFNPETWDFNSGKEWTKETKNQFLKLIDRPYIKRVSILGGEPLAEQNLNDVLSLIKEIHISFPEKTIWLYTGFTWEDIMYKRMPHPPKYTQADFLQWNKRKEIISLCNVVVDGEYIDEQRNLSKKWAGSDNQRVISVQQSLAQNKVVLYCD